MAPCNWCLQNQSGSITLHALHLSRCLTCLPEIRSFQHFECEKRLVPGDHNFLRTSVLLRSFRQFGKYILAHILLTFCLPRSAAMSKISKLFGGGAGSSSKSSPSSSKSKHRSRGEQATPREAIQKLRETETMLTKKQEYLEGKIQQELAIAKKHGTRNKRGKL